MVEKKAFKFIEKPKSMEDALNNVSYQLDVLIRMQGLSTVISTIPPDAVEAKSFMVQVMEAIVDQYNKDIGVDQDHVNAVIDKLKEMKVS